MSNFCSVQDHVNSLLNSFHSLPSTNQKSSTANIAQNMLFFGDLSIFLLGFFDARDLSNLAQVNHFFSVHVKEQHEYKCKAIYTMMVQKFNAPFPYQITSYQGFSYYKYKGYEECHTGYSQHVQVIGAMMEALKAYTQGRDRSLPLIEQESINQVFGNMLNPASKWSKCIEAIREDVQHYPGESEIHQQFLTFVDESLMPIVRLALHHTVTDLKK